MSDNFTYGYCVREPSWHSKEKLYSRNPVDADEASEWADHQWEPIEWPLATPRPIYSDAGVIIGHSWEAVPESKLLVRSDNHFKLATVSADYPIIHNRDMYEIIMALLETDKNIKWDTGGNLYGGKKVYVCVYLDEPFQIPGDPSLTYSYLAAQTDHTANGSLKGLRTNTRIVCANTYAVAEAESERSGLYFQFRHKGNWRDRMEEAKLAINGMREERQRYIELATELAHIGTTQVQRREFVERFIPFPVGDMITQRVESNIERDRAKVWGYLNGPTCEGIRETAYGLMQAGGEFADHGRGYRNKDSYTGRQLLRPEKMKGRIYSLVKEVVGV